MLSLLAYNAGRSARAQSLLVPYRPLAVKTGQDAERAHLLATVDHTSPQHHLLTSGTALRPWRESSSPRVPTAPETPLRLDVRRITAVRAGLGGLRHDYGLPSAQRRDK